MDDIERDSESLCFAIPSSLDFVREALETVEAFFNEFNISKSMSRQNSIILRELLVNAIQHGHSYKSNLKVHVRIAHVRDKQFKIIVEDKGKGFDYRNVERSKLEDVRAISKRGYVLISKLAEHLEFNEKGNCVTVYTLNSVYL